METVPRKRTKYLAEFAIGAGYILFFCLALAFCSALYYISYQQQPQSSPINTFATSLPPTTPTSHILPAEAKNASEIFKDDFSNDSHGWEGSDDFASKQVTLGKLLFKSVSENSYVFTGCGSCPNLGSPFFLQADFSTGKATDKGYGIYFNYEEEKNDNFFLFRINPEARKYYFYQGDDDGWSLLAAGESSEIQSFPAVNHLGIYANKDLVELYVNGKIIDSYRQSGHVFHKGDFGFYLDGLDSQLVVDNLLITKAGDK
jgi:hypothetical protein